MDTKLESQANEKIVVQTERFGELTANVSDLVRFTLPILGFEHATRFLLIQHKDDSPFLWLQSVDDGDLAFVLTQPKLFGIPYTLTIPDHAIDALEIQHPGDVEIYTLVSIPDDAPTAMTANLMGPVVIHCKTRLAAQIILDSTRFSTKTPLFQSASAEADLQWLTQNPNANQSEQAQQAISQAISKV
ncbi:MAG: flagellar assembly protein FliW [Vampirovibrionales bacterium]|nr:flagellar assembly protein FliW [Vampirovibrionales bacterium]